MTALQINGIDLAYDWHGSEPDPVVLLIMGLGLPSSAWPPDFIASLVAAGYRVLTFDNRDSGRSQILEQGKPPNIVAGAFRYLFGRSVRAPYQLDDMAADALGLLDALGVERAHVVGASMGGMIAQIMARKSPSHVLSLTSIMSTTNDRALPKPRWPVSRYVLRRGKSISPESLRRYHEGFWPLIQSPAYPHTSEELHEFLDRLFARGMSSSGAMRQALAILAAQSRRRSLGDMRLPALVIHGDADPLLPVEHGYATAEAIPDAEIMILEGMGHDLPKALLPAIASAIVAHARVADSEAAAPAWPLTPSGAENRG